MTFNHAPFIRNAMDGIMMQITDFPVEVIVGDDFSSDETLSIINEYKSTDRILIKILNRKKNDEYWVKRQSLGRLYNLINIMENCNGKYIAILDGDDFWTDPNKLQKQVDFLENNSDYSMCFHQAEVWGIEQKRLYNVFDKNTTITFFDIIKQNSISTASILYRNLGFYSTIDKWFYNLSAGDWALNLIHASKGKIYYLNECMSVYRKHSGGVWSGLSDQQMLVNGINILEQLNSVFGYEYNDQFQTSIKSRKDRIKNTIDEKSFLNNVVTYFRKLWYRF